MSEEFIERSEFYSALQTRDVELREHFDGVCGAAMIRIADTEKAMGEKLSKNIKWLIGTILLVASAYATVAVTMNTYAKAEQTATDTEQTQQILDAWRAIERSAAIAGEHSSSATREFDQTNETIKEIRRETQERILQLEAIQREHERERGNGH